MGIFSIRPSIYLHTQGLAGCLAGSEAWLAGSEARQTSWEAWLPGLEALLSSWEALAAWQALASWEALTGWVALVGWEALAGWETWLADLKAWLDGPRAWLALRGMDGRTYCQMDEWKISPFYRTLSPIAALTSKPMLLGPGLWDLASWAWLLPPALAS